MNAQPSPTQTRPAAPAAKPATMSADMRTPPAAQVAPATQAQPVTTPATPAPNPATLSIEFVDVDGWPMTLTLTAASGLAVIDAAAVAKKKLIAVGAKPKIFTPAPAAGAAAADQAGEAAPICAIHKTPMTKVNGKKGAFWSCHEKLEDGSFCPYRPTKN